MTWENSWGYWPIWYSLKEVKKNLEEKRKKLDNNKKVFDLFSIKGDVKTKVDSLIKQKK